MPGKDPGEFHTADYAGARRSLRELTATDQPAWPPILEWVAAARNPVEIVPVERARGEATLRALQVTARSVLGALALETAGLLVDQGWLRILGAGGGRIGAGLLAWNRSETIGTEPPPADALIIAHDAIGGFFAVNGGGLPGEAMNVCYFAPDSLRWEDLGFGQADFTRWALMGNLAGFYAGQRWPGWEADVAVLSGDRGIHIYPPLWTREPPMAVRSRRAIPMHELWGLHNDYARQLAGLPDGTPVEMSVEE